MQIVYFVQGKQTGLIKIGTSTTLANVFVRFKELQKINCDELDLLAVGRPLDGVNNKLMFTVARGEWFHPTTELLAYISVISNRPVPGTTKLTSYDVSQKIWKKHGYTPQGKSKTIPRKPPQKVSLIRPFNEVKFGPEEEKLG